MTDLRRRVVFASVLIICASGAIRASQGVGYRVIRVVAGPAGAESNGRFVLTEERASFNRAQDTQVVVFFQWEGTPGTAR